MKKNIKLIIGLAFLAGLVLVFLIFQTTKERVNLQNKAVDRTDTFSPPPRVCYLQGKVPTLTPTPTSTSTPTPTGTPTPTPTSTLTPTPTRPSTMIVIQGRVYEDLLDMSPYRPGTGSIGRAGFQAEIPICFKHETPAKCVQHCRGGNDWPCWLSYTFDLMVGFSSSRSPMTYIQDVANKPNLLDVCSDNHKQEKQFCPGKSCSVLGGFSLTIDSTTPKYVAEGKEYYVVRFNANKTNRGDAIDNQNTWLVTEAYWMDTSSGVQVPPKPTALPYFLYDGSGTRCDYTSELNKRFDRRAEGQAQCNTCTGRASESEIGNWALVCKTDSRSNWNARYCNLLSYRSDLKSSVIILVPVDDPRGNSRSLWIGVAPKAK